MGKGLAGTIDRPKNAYDHRSHRIVVTGGHPVLARHYITALHSIPFE